MARYSPDHKEKTRETLVDLAARRVCAEGFGGLSVAGLMAEAGLTHGGFYAHFASRDDLLAAATLRLFDRGCETLDRFAAKYGEAGAGKYVDFYLSPRHRDETELGCPVPSLAGDVRHAAPQVKAAFDAGMAKLAARLGGMLGGDARAGMELLGEMAGVLAVARTVRDGKRSNELLAAARKGVRV